VVVGSEEKTKEMSVGLDLSFVIEADRRLARQYVGDQKIYTIGGVADRIVIHGDRLALQEKEDTRAMSC
jgi:hypothetical protein